MKSIGAAFFDRMPFLTSTTCVGCNMCYVFTVNVTDSFDDRRSQWIPIALWELYNIKYYNTLMKLYPIVFVLSVIK